LQARLPGGSTRPERGRRNRAYLSKYRSMYARCSSPPWLSRIEGKRRWHPPRVARVRLSSGIMRTSVRRHRSHLAGFGRSPRSGPPDALVQPVHFNRGSGSFTCVTSPTTRIKSIPFAALPPLPPLFAALAPLPPLITLLVSSRRVPN